MARRKPVKFTKTWPTKSGWYWCRYLSKHRRIIQVPCGVDEVCDTWCARTARNDMFFKSQPQDIKFGPYIPFPD